MRLLEKIFCALEAFALAMERVWKKANRWWRMYIVLPLKRIFCKHDKAIHSKAMQYDANPPHQRMRWAIVQREVCPKCGKALSKSRVVRDNLSTTRCKEIMRQLERQQIRDFN